MIGITWKSVFKLFSKVYFYMKKNQLYRKFFKLRKHAEKGQYILKRFHIKNKMIADTKT